MNEHNVLNYSPGGQFMHKSEFFFLHFIASLTGMTRDCRALQCKIQEYRENNSVVARTINELHQEVSDALEERIALEYQLEQLKSFGDE